MAASEGWRSFFRTEREVLRRIRDRLSEGRARPATASPSPPPGPAPAGAPECPMPRAWRRGRAPRRREPPRPTLARRVGAALRRVRALALSLAVHAGLLALLAAVTLTVLEDREAYVRVRFLRDLPHTASLPRRDETATPDPPAEPRP
ncbi:MAG: hypothetical protein HY722_11790, partial [Planctomycetes bacterium]|nr:hypothetical protein [Planctomycetota bacterium]